MTGGSSRAAPTGAQRAGVIRERLAALELQYLDLLADESVPGRKHRLDAVRAARHDLRSELSEPSGLADHGAVRVPVARHPDGWVAAVRARLGRRC